MNWRDRSPYRKYIKAKRSSERIHKNRNRIKRPGPAAAQGVQESRRQRKK
jgi:hypothetical protein